MSDRRSTIEAYVRAYARGLPDEAVELIAERCILYGPRTCIWHEVARWHQGQPDTRAVCSWCGGRGRFHPDTSGHELCRLRALKGQPTPRMETERMRCGCARCEAAGVYFLADELAYGSLTIKQLQAARRQGVLP